ncbi:MAG: hypothetical protein PHO40_02595 [Candidatus Omnitrophica bacterium]|nr:hypothetical protein [Candidatus Omnitrophota bacterium]
MNFSRISITKNQKKIISVSAAGVFIFLLAWVFFYLPGSKEANRLKDELALTQQQIQGIESLLSGSQNRDEAIRILKSKQQYLSNKFPSQEEDSIKLIPEIARKMNIEVVSLQPGSRSEFIDENGKPVVIDGKVASFLPITMEVVCFYKDMVGYLLELKNVLPAFISVQNLNAKKDNQSTGKIRSTIGFNLYLLI